MAKNSKKDAPVTADAPKKIMVRKKKITELLKCDLTTTELLDYGQRAADAQEQASRLQSQMKASAKEFKGKIDTHIAEGEVLNGAIRSRYEYRQIECEVTENFTDKTITTVRLDTNEVVKTRKMNSEELQELPLDTTEVKEGAVK